MIESKGIPHTEVDSSAVLASDVGRFQVLKDGSAVRNLGERKPQDLIAVGPIRRDFELLGINTVAELARREPEAMYQELCRKMRKRQDVCVLDTFRAVEQARNPSLPPEQCVWWYWSPVRKASVVRTRE